jgi:hypothetical protein
MREKNKGLSFVFILVSVFFDVEKLCIQSNPICQFLLLFPRLLVFYTENNYQVVVSSLWSYIMIFDPFWFDIYTRLEIGFYLQLCKCGYPIFPALFVEEAVISLIHVFDSFVKSQMAMAVWDYFWIFYSISLVYISVLCQSYAVLVLWLYSIIWIQILCYLQLVHLRRIAFAIHNLLGFHMDFRIGFPVSVSNDINILMGIVLNM